MKQTVIDQVLLLLNRSVSEELGRVLWAATKEVEAFYNRDQQRAVFRRTYLSDVVPDDLLGRHGRFLGFKGLSKMWDSLLEKFGVDDSGKKEATSKEQFVKKTPEDSWHKAKGRFYRTYDAIKIAAMVRELLGEERQGDTPVIVTDQELTPPPEWRYIIWDGDATGGVVVSTVPTDPEYWRISDPNRVALIKHRVRTSCLQIIGRLIGLDFCDNERCFLFHQVDSVLRLDHMVELGSEHKIEELVGRGYKVRVNDPSIVQSIEENPEPATEGF